MSNKCFVSIIVPIYNVEQYLDQCVSSVLSQSFRDFELILVDDGSPDHCAAMCDDYAINDPRVQVLHKKNGGLSDARNAGLEKASGEYVLFLDADDYWEDENALAEKHDLTARERQILNFVLEFQNNDEIAASLGISENTVQKHLQNIFRKMNVSSKWELLQIRRGKK